MKVTEKPWGKEELLEANTQYVVKRLTMKKGHRCSLQYHEKKRETVYVLSGRLKVLIGAKVDELKEHIFSSGDYFTLEPGTIHRMEGIQDSVYLEASTTELDDVIRLKDDYKRT